LPHLIDVWKAGAPALDFLAPDIYFTNFVDIVNTYKRPDNPLFIPEANNADHPQVPGNAFYAIGKLDAIGFGPFSIESVDEKPGALPVPMMCWSRFRRRFWRRRGWAKCPPSARACSMMKR
jgi:hypothetical protein